MFRFKKIVSSQLKCFLIPFYCSLLFSSYAQNTTYNGQGCVSEIIMPSATKMIGHFGLFFESTIAFNDSNRKFYWYKIVFTDSGNFDFSLFPLYETDCYAYKVFKIKNNQNFCEAKVKHKIIPINNIKKDVVYNNTEQSDSFRANLMFTKKTHVNANDAIYIVIKHERGNDSGHILGVNTGDYSYVLKTIKLERVTDSLTHNRSIEAELTNEKAIASVENKLCPTNGPVLKLSVIKFNEKNFMVNNELYANADQTSGTTKIIQSKKGITIDSSITQSFVQTASLLTSISPVERTNLVSVKCIITDAEKGFVIDALPIITEELYRKNIRVNKINKGACELLAERNKNYRIECNVFGYKNYEAVVDIFKVLNGEEKAIEIKLSALKTGDNFILSNIYFHANTPIIKVESNKELEKLCDFMKSSPNAIISIEGHTNSNRFIQKDETQKYIDKRWEFNGTAKKLSEYRANEVKNYLVKKGIATERIKCKGWGGSKELYPNAKTLEHSTKNMRVEIVILKT